MVYPERDAYEIKMFHQEDAGLNVEMAKLAFAKGIWSFACKMDNALCIYFMIRHPQTSPVDSAITIVQKIPLELEAVNRASSLESPAAPSVHELYTGEAKVKKLTRKAIKETGS